MNKPLAVAVLSTAGLFAGANVASADELSFGISFGGKASPRGFAALHVDGSPGRRSKVVRRHRPHGPVIVVDPVRPAYPVMPGPVVPVDPSCAPEPVVDDGACDETVFIPAHGETRTEVVCEPAVYDDRCVPVFETRCVPVFETICVPILAERCDPLTGHVVQVKVGERRERVQVGTREERVKVGERHERVLVRAEVCRRVVRRVEVPGRYVTIVDGPAYGRAIGGETMTLAQYEAEMARIGRLPPAEPVR